MGMPSDDDVVQIQSGKWPGEPCIITVNCPDKAGLGCDICRIILDFGLYITKGDFSTDGIWCYIVLWVVPHSGSLSVIWSNLKDRLQAICPSCSASFYFNQQPTRSSPVYLLKFCCLDRKGLLHDVTQVLCELELAIQKLKVTTTPDGGVLDLFFITDNMELLHTRRRQDEVCERFHALLKESCISCELQLVGPEYEYNQSISSLSPVLAEALFRCELSDNEMRSQALSPHMIKLKKTNVRLDNSLSPAHTLLQICCADHKGLLYDIMRTMKDMNMKTLYGRFLPNTMGYRDLELFIQQKDGKKIMDPEKQDALCSRLRLEMLHPLRVIIADRGPDAELLVANPVELSGKGRPRVFYDVTFALKTLGICVFSALANSSQRRNLLQELFADIALEVDDRAKDIIFSKDEDVISPADDVNDGLLCFYDVLADYFVRVPESGNPILHLIVQLWSQSFASHIFALLFHKWLFEVQLDNPEVLLRYSSALVEGSTNVFWIDIQTNTRRFQSLFHYLLEDVALDQTRLNKIPLQAQRDMYLLLSRFILFYNSADKMESFLKQCPVFPNALLVGGPADIFVTELTDQLHKLKVEPVLLHYLSQIKVLQGMELRMTTSTRLKTCLYSFTSPGGPMYPTRAVRHAAWEALDLLFPVGRYPRHLISLFFRLLYPWYWPSSCWNLVISCVKAIFYSLLRLLFSNWEKLAKPKSS